MAEAKTTKEQPGGTDTFSFRRRSLSSDSLDSLTSDFTQSVASEAPDTMSTISALYSRGSTHVPAFPPPAFPLSASTMDLRVNGKKQPKKGLRGLAQKLRRKNSGSSSDLVADSTTTSTADAAAMSTSDLSDTFRLRMGTIRGRLHLKDSHASDRKVSTATLFGRDSQSQLDKSLQELNLTVDEVDAGAPPSLPSMDINPFGSELQGGMLEEVYKSALGCFVNGTERLVSEHGDLANRYLRKAFKLTDTRHQEMLHQVQLEQKPDITLHVRVKRADYLMARKGHGKSDPYCKLAVVKSEQERTPLRDLADWRKDRTLGELLICQTDVKYRTLEPEWNQDFSVQLKDSGSGFLAVEIWDSEDKIGLKQVRGLKGLTNYLKDLRGGNDFLGKTYISLKDLPLTGEDSWYQVRSHRGRLRGRVQLKLHIDIKMKGVSHGVALEHYERLFEALCSFESRCSKTSSTPDLASMETHDKWNPDWSGKMSSSAVMLLSLFASQHNITQLEQCIVHLNSLLKYHQRYRVSLSTFHGLYTAILTLQDELVLDVTAENGAAAQDSLSQDWQTQKLYACTRFLTDEIHDVIKNHPVELNLRSSLEVDRFRQQVGLLKDLYQVKVFQTALPTEETNLSEVITKEIEHSCAHWYHLLEKKALEDSPGKLLTYLGLVRSVAIFLKMSRETLQSIFNEVDVNYFETVYVAVEGQLAAGLSDALSEELPQTSHTAYILYLSLKEFQTFSTFVSEEQRDQLKLSGYHTHFHGMVNDWIALATLRFKDAVVRATQMAEEEETVTEEAKFSSTARDLIDLVVVVCSFWKNLGWPVATESFEYLTTLIQNVCSGMVMFSNESCRKLKVANFFNPTPDTFKTTKKLCIALNDIEQVRRGVQELPEFINWVHFQEVMAQEASPEEAAAADRVLKYTLSTMDQGILLELTSLTEHIAEKMRPDIKRGLRKVMVATTPDAIEEVISPLMTYLHGNLQELRASLFRSVFLKLLSHIWLVLVEKMWKYASSTRNETVSFCLHSLLNLLFAFFHAEGEGLAKDVMETKQYNVLHEVLSYRVMPTEKVIQQYYEALADFQAEAPIAKGTITVMVGYMKEKQAVDLELVRATNLPPMTVNKSCDTYLKMSLLLPDKHFSTAERQKSKVYKHSLNPVFDATFSFPTMRVHHLQVQGAVLAIEVYSYDRLHSHTPIGVVVIRCKDIPILAPNTVPEDDELVVESPQKRSLTLPIIAPCDSPALAELSERSKDAVAIAFAKRMKKLKAGLPTSKTAVQKLNSHFPKRLLKLKKSKA